MGCHSRSIPQKCLLLNIWTFLNMLTPLVALTVDWLPTENRKYFSIKVLTLLHPQCNVVIEFEATYLRSWDPDPVPAAFFYPSA